MKRFIVFLMLLSCFAFSETERKNIEGEVRIYNKATYLKGCSDDIRENYKKLRRKYNPGFKIILNYKDAEGKMWPLYHKFRVSSDDWTFIAYVDEQEIRDPDCVSISPTLFDFEKYRGWEIEQPPPAINLPLADSNITFTSALVILIKKIPGLGLDKIDSFVSSIKQDVIEQIPTTRTPWGISQFIATIMGDGLADGFCDPSQDSGFMIAAGSQDSATWNLDGTNITDPSAIIGEYAYFNINSVREIQVAIGANDVNAQTGGTQLNFVSKQAGNKTTGDFYLYVQDKAWESEHDITDFMNATGLEVPGINRLYQYGVNIGGPIKKEKLWWFGSWGVDDIHKRTEVAAENSRWLVSGYGKLDFRTGNTAGQFLLSYNTRNGEGQYFLSPAQQDADSLRDHDSTTHVLSGKLSHAFGNLILDLKVVYTDSGFSLSPNGSDIHPETGHSEGNDMKIVDGWSRVEGSAWDYSTNRESFNASLAGNYFMDDVLGGDHEIRFGIDYYTSDTTTQSLTPNQRILYIYRDDPSLNYIAISPDYHLAVNFKRISAYIRDTITFGKLTASIGIRCDKEKGKVKPFSQPFFTWYEPGSPFHGTQRFSEEIDALDVEAMDVPADWSLLSPRLSFTYDISGNGKYVLRLFAGRYMSQSGNTMASAFIPHRWAHVDWTDTNGDEVPQFAELGVFQRDYGLYRHNPATGLNRVEFDPDYNSPYLDELTLMFETFLTDDLSFSLTGFYKNMHNLSKDVNSRGETGNVIKGILADGSIETKDNWESTGSAVVGGTEVPTYERIEDPIGYYYYNLEKARDRYLGLQFVLEKRHSYGWMAKLSFTLQDWKRFRFEDETLDMNNFDFFNEGVVAPAATDSGLSDIWINSTWMVKFTGMFRLPWDINLTAFFQVRKGYPQPLRRHVVLKQGGTYLYRDGFKAGEERLPTFWMLNLGLEKTLRISGTMTATLVVDCYNAFNNQIELKHNLAIGAETPTASAPTLWSTPRIFQFGVRVSF